MTGQNPGSASEISSIHRVLVSNFAPRAAVDALNRCVALLIVPILLGGLGVEGYGIYSLGLSLVAAFPGLLTFRFPLAMLRFYPGERRDAGPVLMSGLLLWGLIAVSSISLCLIEPEGLSSLLLGSPAYGSAITCAVAAGLSVALFDIVSIPLRAESDFRAISIIDVVERLLFLGLSVALAFHSRMTVEAALLLLACTYGLKAASVQTISLRGVVWRAPNFRLMRQMLAFSLPFIPHLAAIWLIERGASFFVMHELGERAAGLWGVAYSMGVLVDSVALPIQSVLFPLLRRAYDEKRLEEVESLTNLAMRLVMVLGVFVGVTLIAGGRPILTILGMVEAVPPAAAIGLLCAAYLGTSLRQLAMNVIHLERRTSILIWISPISAVISYGIFILFMADYGIWIAGLGLLVGVMFQNIALRMQMSDELSPDPSSRFVVVLGLVGCLVFLFQWYAAELNPYLWLVVTTLAAPGYIRLLSLGRAVTKEELKLVRLGWLAVK